MFNSCSSTAACEEHPLPLNLPAPRHGPLAHSPLALVVCQLRYADPAEPISAVISAEVARSLDAAGFKYPKVEPVRLSTVSLGVTAAGIQPLTGSIPATAYRMTSEDTRWQVTIAPDSVSLETTRYGRWQGGQGEFLDRFMAVLRAVVEHIRPAVRVRLGLRYVDVLGDPNVASVRGWIGKIAGEFLGPLTDENFAPSVLVTQQQLTLEVSETLRAVLRHGAFRDPDEEPEWRYLIDTDVFEESFLRFEVPDIETTLDAIHIASKQLFQYVITPQYYDVLTTGVLE